MKQDVEDHIVYRSPRTTFDCRSTDCYTKRALATRDLDLETTSRADWISSSTNRKPPTFMQVSHTKDPHRLVEILQFHIKPWPKREKPRLIPWVLE
jgi:hypothetical protein